MIDTVRADAPRLCARCATELPALVLACPACAALVHRERLQELAARAEAATAANDRETARALWEQALGLVPPTSGQHREICARIVGLTSDQETPARVRHEGGGSWWKPLLGTAAAVGLLLAGKLKFLLLGLSKASTVFSMFGFIAVYWSIHGWPLAAGIAGTIYVHEMGHVAMLRRLGIHADAPLFIPGIGAVVMMREHITDPLVNARIGLAGPVWGLGATVAAWLVYTATGAAIWLAIAELTAFINLFNLIPIWQLDGAWGFRALSRDQRWAVLGVIAVALWITGVRMLWIVGAVAMFQAFRTDAGPGHRPTVVTFAGLVLALAWFARAVG
jgi:Zn-dependent protease